MVTTAIITREDMMKLDWKDKLRLKVAPHGRYQYSVVKTIGDIDIVAYLLLSETKEDITSAAFSFTWCDQLGVDVPEIWRIAEQNTKAKEHPMAISLMDILEDPRNIYNVNSFLDPSFGLNDKKAPLVITNRKRFNGAAAIFLPKVADRIGELLESDYYIAFTSVHEAIIHVEGEIDVDNIKGAMGVVKDTTTSDEFVTTNVYKYTRETRAITLVD